MAVMDVSILVLLLGVEQELEWKKVNFGRIRNFAKISLSFNQFLFNP